MLSFILPEIKGYKYEIKVILLCLFLPFSTPNRTIFRTFFIVFGIDLALVKI